MDHATFVRPDLTTFCRLDELGLEAVGQRVEPDRAVIQCRVLEPDPWCRECGAEGVPRDTVIRRLAHEPFGHRPTTLMVRVRRYRCVTCRRTWRQDTSKAAAPRAKITRGGVGWALTGVVVDHLTVSRVAAGLGVSWHTANEAVIAEGKRVLIDDPARFAGVTTIGVDEHVWRHTRHGDKYVTVIIDLTPARNKSGPARLLDMVAGRSKAVFKQWLADRPRAWRDGVEVVAMDGLNRPGDNRGREIGRRRFSLASEIHRRTQGSRRRTRHSCSGRSGDGERGNHPCRRRARSEQRDPASLGP